VKNENGIGEVRLD